MLNLRGVSVIACNAEERDLATTGSLKAVLGMYINIQMGDSE